MEEFNTISKKDRMTDFFNINPDRFDKETQVKILRPITDNKFDNKNVAYDPTRK